MSAPLSDDEEPVVKKTNISFDGSLPQNILQAAGLGGKDDYSSSKQCFGPGCTAAAAPPSKYVLLALKKDSLHLLYFWLGLHGVIVKVHSCWLCTIKFQKFDLLYLNHKEVDIINA